MTQPNVLMLVMDDQRADTIAALGNPWIQTPCFDRITRRGTAFKKTFVTCPICTPGRAELLTGCNSFQNGVPWFGMPIKPSLTLLPQAFAGAGYYTIHAGKWHNDGHPRDKGYAAVRREMHDAKDHAARYREHGHTLIFEEDGGLISGHSTELFVEGMLEELEKAPTDKPWFGYLALHSPHDPFNCPEPYHSMYDRSGFPLPDNYMPEHPFDIGDLLIRDELLLPFPRQQEQVRRYRAQYYGMITHHDYHFSRVIALLEAKGMLENTIVVITGDHGLAVGSHGLLGKESMYDHSIGIPLIMAGPNIPSGTHVDALTRNTDVFPTLCELCDIEPPNTIQDGKSLIPLMSGSTTRLRDEVYSAFISPSTQEPGHPLHDTQRALRTEQHKLTYFPGAQRFQLFDMADDPLELHDLLRGFRIAPDPLWRYEPKHPRSEVLALAEGLRERMLAKAREFGDDGIAEQLPHTSVQPSVP